jgi:hypothetical protein
MSKKIKLCCGGRGCPTIEKEGSNVIITDDEGNKVIITEGEANLISSALEEL